MRDAGVAAAIAAITLLGFYYMWRESVSWREFREAEKLRETQPVDSAEARK